MSRGWREGLSLWMSRPVGSRHRGCRNGHCRSRRLCQVSRVDLQLSAIFRIAAPLPFVVIVGSEDDPVALASISAGDGSADTTAAAAAKAATKVPAFFMIACSLVLECEDVRRQLEIKKNFEND